MRRSAERPWQWTIAWGALCVGCASAGSIGGRGDDDDAGTRVDASREPRADAGERARDASLADASPPSDAGPTLPAACDGATGERDRSWALRVGERDRAADVHLPPGYDARTPMPVVLSFHALGSSASVQASYTRLAAVADEAGFVLVHPEGVGASWNAGSCCGTAQATGVDDVGFARALIDRIEAELCIDATRIYATGMSNGGYISHRLGCELADRLAAIAPVAGIDATATCEPTRALPVLQIHGTLDTVVPYAGATRSVEAWRERNGCDDTSTRVQDETGVECDRWSACRDGAEVELCTVRGGSHVWPGGLASPSALDASRTVWEFLSRHRLD